MELLKLLLVDDEPIILKGLEMTYDWEKMGFQVVGAAESSEEALALLEDEEPDVVITDIRMKKLSGLDLIRQSRECKRETKFIVVSAYKDFEYARVACEQGALAYLVKPIDEQELEQAMQKAYEICMEEQKERQKMEGLRRILSENDENFFAQVLEQYMKGKIAESEFRILADESVDRIGVQPRFCCVCADLDVTYKITNQMELDALRYLFFTDLEEQLKSQYKTWVYPGKDGNQIYLINLGEEQKNTNVKKILEQIKEQNEKTIISAISNVYMGLGGIQTAYRQAMRLFEIADEAGAGILSLSGRQELPISTQYFEDTEAKVLQALRKNSENQLKSAFEELVYCLPKDEKVSKKYLHCLAVRAEVLMDDSYGISDNIRLGFEKFYHMLEECTLVRLIDLLYKLFGAMIEERVASVPPMAEVYFSDYMENAIKYMKEHLSDEELSIVTVAESVYLNPVYFGRLFKNVMGISFKKYLLNERMERAKKLILTEQGSIAQIGRSVGIINPSYFSQLFKQHTGKMPSEYKREYKE